MIFEDNYLIKIIVAAGTVLRAFEISCRHFWVDVFSRSDVT